MKLKITRCPTCGSDQIGRVQRDWLGVYQDQPYVVPNLEIYECPNCGERLLDHEAMQAIEAQRTQPADAPAHRRSA